MLSTVVSRKSWRLAVLATALLAVATTAAQSAQARNAYVTNGGAAGKASIFSDVSNTFTASVNVGNIPFGIAITPDGSKAYVANNTSNSVTRINTADDSTTTIGGLRVGPWGVAASPDGSKVYVTNNTGNAISVIDVATSEFTAFLPAAISGPRGVAVSPDGSRLYVANFGNDNVLIFNTADNSLLGTIELGAGAGPDGIAITPNGAKLYVANIFNNTATAITLSPLSVKSISQASLGGSSAKGVAITPDGSTAYVTSSGVAGSSVAAINTANDTVSSVFATGTSRPFYPAVNPAGTRLYVPNFNDSTLAVIDTATNGNVVTPVSGITNPQQAAVIPDQAPTANVTATAAAACADTSFDGSASTDSDGTVASYGWDFGDGKTATTTTPTTTHAYDKAGAYTATLTVTDNEGTSTQKVFTGQTMLRNGSSSAAKSTSVTIASPAAPTVTVTKPQARKRYNRRTFRRINGTASDPCGAKQVNYALALSKGGTCRFLGNTGKLGRTRRSCSKPIFRKAKLSGKKWSKTLGHRLPKGAYRLFAKATNNADVTSSSKRIRFRLR